MNGRWAIEGRRLVFGSSPADGDVVVLKAVVRVPPHADDADLMFVGDEAAARHCESPVRLRYQAFICELMANAAKTAEEIELWLHKKNTKMLEHQMALEQARADVRTAQNGNKARIRVVFP